MGFDHLHTGANSTKTRWIVSSMHSGTLSLSHCKMLRISGESVSNHHGQINDSNTKQEDARRSCISRNGIWSFTHRCKLNQDKVNSVKHALRNAIVVSPQDAQNQRGKRFKSSRANQRLKHQARRCKKMQEDHAYLEMGFAHLHTGENSTKTRWIVSSMHSGTLSLSHCKMLRISGESVSNHHGQINDSNTN